MEINRESLLKERDRIRKEINQNYVLKVEAIERNDIDMLNKVTKMNIYLVEMEQTVQGILDFMLNLQQTSESLIEFYHINTQMLDNAKTSVQKASINATLRVIQEHQNLVKNIRSKLS